MEVESFGKLSIVTDTGNLPELITNDEKSFIVNVYGVRTLTSKMYLVTKKDSLIHKMGTHKKPSQVSKVRYITKQKFEIGSNFLQSEYLPYRNNT